MSEKELDNEFVDMEVERILLLFEENNYTLKQKNLFIESKLMDIKNNNDLKMLAVYHKINDIINNKE